MTTEPDPDSDPTDPHTPISEDQNEDDDLSTNFDDDAFLIEHGIPAPHLQRSTHTDQRSQPDDRRTQTDPTGSQSNELRPDPNIPRSEPEDFHTPARDDPTPLNARHKNILNKRRRLRMIRASRATLLEGADYQIAELVDEIADPAYAHRPSHAPILVLHNKKRSLLDLSSLLHINDISPLRGRSALDPQLSWQEESSLEPRELLRARILRATVSFDPRATTRRKKIRPATSQEVAAKIHDENASITKNPRVNDPTDFETSSKTTRRIVSHPTYSPDYFLWARSITFRDSEADTTHVALILWQTVSSELSMVNAREQDWHRVYIRWPKTQTVWNSGVRFRVRGNLTSEIDLSRTEALYPVIVSKPVSSRFRHPDTNRPETDAEYDPIQKENADVLLRLLRQVGEPPIKLTYEAIRSTDRLPLTLDSTDENLLELQGAVALLVSQPLGATPLQESASRATRVLGSKNATQRRHRIRMDGSRPVEFVQTRENARIQINAELSRATILKLPRTTHLIQNPAPDPPTSDTQNPTLDHQNPENPTHDDQIPDLLHVPTTPDEDLRIDPEIDPPLQIRFAQKNGLLEAVVFLKKAQKYTVFRRVFPAAIRMSLVHLRFLEDERICLILRETPAEPETPDINLQEEELGIRLNELITERFRLPINPDTHEPILPRAYAPPTKSLQSAEELFFYPDFPRTREELLASYVPVASTSPPIQYVMRSPAYTPSGLRNQIRRQLLPENPFDTSFRARHLSEEIQTPDSLDLYERDWEKEIFFIPDLPLFDPSESRPPKEKVQRVPVTDGASQLPRIYRKPLFSFNFTPRPVSENDTLENRIHAPETHVSEISPLNKDS